MNNIISQIRTRIVATLGHHTQVVALFTAATIIILFAFAFMLAAAQSWLTQWFQSPIEADLTVAGSLAIVALAIAIVGERMRRAPRPEMTSPISLAVAAPIALQIAPKLLNGKTLAMASLLLGAILIRREFGNK